MTFIFCLVPLANQSHCTSKRKKDVPPLSCCVCLPKFDLKSQKMNIFVEKRNESKAKNEKNRSNSNRSKIPFVKLNNFFSEKKSFHFFSVLDLLGNKKSKSFVLNFLLEIPIIKNILCAKNFVNFQSKKRNSTSIIPIQVVFVFVFGNSGLCFWWLF